ncbi:MAG: GreA/GreB family elongation factor [Bacteroidales bacterium]|jgi:transcription elongation factor GreB|nr:GreA/GreB family elongation factor [Bacteroidales bacterium]
MSRGFVREGDQEEVPLVPQRAYLPAGVTNFVTPAGMQLLLDEKQMLLNERENPGSGSEDDRRIALNHINAKLRLLNNRIAEARVVDPKDQPQDEIRFGATVTLKNESSGKIQTFQITGVDEADIAAGKISFISPLSRVLMNRKAGERIALKRDNKDIIYLIMGIEY